MKKSRTGFIKVSSLSNNRDNQSDPRLDRMMSRNINHMYRDITKQETEKSSILIQVLHVNLDSNKATGTSPATHNVSMTLQPTMYIYPITATTVPEDLKYIHPRPSQVWNHDKISFDPNGSWRKLVCTYKLFTGDKMWRTQTGERAPFWCTSLIFTRADGQCFIPHVIFHQAENYTQDIRYNILKDWVNQNTSYGYIDRGG